MKTKRIALTLPTDLIEEIGLQIGSEEWNAFWRTIMRSEMQRRRALGFGNVSTDQAKLAEGSSNRIGG